MEAESTCVLTALQTPFSAIAQVWKLKSFRGRKMSVSTEIQSLEKLRTFFIIVSVKR